MDRWAQERHLATLARMQWVGTDRGGRVMAEAWRWPAHILSDTARAQAMELQELTFVIPQVPPSLNALLRMHWKERRKLSLQWAKLIWAARAEQVRGLFPRFDKASVTIER